LISITEEIAVPSPPERVWEIISDPSAVVSCIGDAELGPSYEDGSFDGTLAIRFGGLRVKFAARVSLDLDETAREGRLTARGADGQGATRFSAGAIFRVVEGDAPGTARVFCDGEIKLSGKLAKLIESGAGMVVSGMTKEFADQLVQKCAPASAEPLATASDGAHMPRPSGLFARLRAWWEGRRSRRAGQAAQAAQRSEDRSGEALGQGGRR
jgi:carbon monoxide dehydrogenase subunit G